MEVLCKLDVGDGRGDSFGAVSNKVFALQGMMA